MLSDIQRRHQSPDNLCAKMTNGTGEIMNIINKWRSQLRYLDKIEGADIVAINEGQSNPITDETRDQLIDIRTIMHLFVDVYDGIPISPTLVPRDVIDAVRNL